jgi:hypothetical protein
MGFADQMLLGGTKKRPLVTRLISAQLGHFQGATIR